MNKIRKFVKDHKREITHWGIVIGLEVSVAAVWYAVGKVNGADGWAVTAGDIYVNNITDEKIVLLRHKNGKGTQLNLTRA